MKASRSETPIENEVIEQVRANVDVSAVAVAKVCRTIDATLRNDLDVLIHGAASSGSDHPLVFSDDDAYYFADPEALLWTMLDADLDVPPDRFELARAAHLEHALEVGAVDDGSSNPIVVAKPEPYRVADQAVTNSLLVLLSSDLSIPKAIDYYFVRRRGWSVTDWAEQRGVSPQAVSANVQRAGGVLEDSN